MENGNLRIAGVGGTLREGSTSLGALRRALAAAEESGAETELLDLRELALPIHEPGKPLDFAQFLARDESPYLDGKVVGLTSTSGGDQGAVNANNAMVHIVHALRGVLAPLTVTAPRAWRRTAGNGDVTDKIHGERLEQPGTLVVRLSGQFGAERFVGREPVGAGV